MEIDMLARHIIHQSQEYKSYRLHIAPQREVRELTEQDLESVMKLLKEDHLRAVHLRGMIEDYGICNSTAFRGQLFGYYENRELKNIALLGHHILIYKEDEGIKQFAEKAAEIKAQGFLVLGPHGQIEEFWSHLSEHGRETRMSSPQLWYVCRRSNMKAKSAQLQLAQPEQLDEIAETHAMLLMEQNGGLDPRDKDPEGFRNRVLDRIERRRTWVKVEDGKIIFKAELVCESSEAVYLEGIWTHPEHRNQGVGTSCTTEFVNRFLLQKKAIGILVEPHEVTAMHIYERIGFVHEEDHQARFLNPID
jgi:predicted GNAT family acetyltransferase